MYALTIYGQPISKPCQAKVVRLYRYRDDAALHAARPDMDGLPVTAHAALLARVRLALLARGQAVVIEYATISA